MNQHRYLEVDRSGHVACMGNCEWRGPLAAELTPEERRAAYCAHLAETGMTNRKSPEGAPRLHRSNCPMVLTPCTCDEPDHPYVLVPRQLLAHLLDERDPATVTVLHEQIAGYLAPGGQGGIGR